jgi:ribosomal protein L11 methyltransferase
MLERLTLTVPDDALEVFEAAMSAHCEAVSFFADEATGTWLLEGVRRPGDIAPLETALALAAIATGIDPPELRREATPAAGWLEKVAASFPPQRIGRSFLVLGTHDRARREPGRIALVLDAELAFGSGEHGSTRGCLRALEMLPPPRGRILDLGTGSGILAIAAARRFRRKVLATDIDRPSITAAVRNARLNGVAHLVRAAPAAGYAPLVRAGAPYRLVLANILARPLSRMAASLALALAPGGMAILSGLLKTQARGVLAAHLRHGLVLRRRIDEGSWTTLVVGAPRKTERRPLLPGIAV